VGRRGPYHGSRPRTRGLLGQLAEATGLPDGAAASAPPRNGRGSRCGKAIASALHRIEAHDPTLARLLTDTLHTDATCRYNPDPARPVTWVLGAPHCPAPLREHRHGLVNGGGPSRQI